jgi:ATPase involved in DNA repair
MLQQIRKSLDQVNGKDKQLDAITERYTESLLNLADISSDLSSYLSQLEADPNRFEKLQDRKASLNSLLKRYGKGSDKEAAFEQLLIDGKSAKERIADLSGGDQRVAELQKEADSLFKQLQDQGLALSKLRKINGEKLSSQVTDEVRSLSMPNASFCD